MLGQSGFGVPCHKWILLGPFGGQKSQGIHGKKSIGLGSHPKMSEKNLEPFVMDSMDWVPVDWPKIHWIEIHWNANP